MEIKTINNLPITGDIVPFRDVKIGQLIAFRDFDDGGVWCKTPVADMFMHNNEQYLNKDCGGFCTAVCVNGTTEYQPNTYIQCDPSTRCIIIKTEKLLGKRKSKQ